MDIMLVKLYGNDNPADNPAAGSLNVAINSLPLIHLTLGAVSRPTSNLFDCPNNSIEKKMIVVKIKGLFFS